MTAAMMVSSRHSQRAAVRSKAFMGVEEAELGHRRTAATCPLGLTLAPEAARNCRDSEMVFWRQGEIDGRKTANREIRKG